MANSEVNKPETPADYRPISILRKLSKVCERVIYTTSNDLIYLKKDKNGDYQSECRKKHSTLTILIKLQDDIKRAMKSGEVTLAVFVDFSKAFDTIDVNILMHKLHALYTFF